MNHPFLLLLVLCSLVAVILWAEGRPRLAPLFHYLPAAFWCYFLPMLLTTMGFLPSSSPLYDALTRYVLPACLLLLLLPVHIPVLAKLGPITLVTMTVGAVGIVIGAVGSYALFSHWLPREAWKGVGALSASWVGGSANMLAVKEGLATPDEIFAPMIVLDTVIVYLWMGMLVALSRFQEDFDRWVGADRSALEDINRRLESLTSSADPSAVRGEGKVAWAFLLLAGSITLGWLCDQVAAFFPQGGGMMSRSAWTFLLVTTLGMFLSLTPASRLEERGASRLGYLLLYLLLTSIGAKARLQAILSVPLYLVLGVVWALIHGVLLVGFGKLFRIPMFFLATSSQANFGGTASAPIVAGVYQPRLAPLGLLLAIAGNLVGTYIGFFTAKICDIFTR